MQWKVDSSLPRRILFRGGEMTLLFLLISLAAQLAVAPLLAHHFHRVYLGALLANLAVVPLATAALWLGVPFLLASTLAWVPVAAVLGNLECWLLERLIDVTDFFAHLPGAYLVLEGGMHLVFLVALPLIFSPAAWSWVTGWITSRQRSLGSP
jgi:predicted membrane metal-binding protein